jgi:DNA-binding Lrp family transcriptional regulator
MDEIDRRLVVATQGGLPLVPRPYHALADVLGIPAAEVRARLAAMLDAGAIRRIGAVPNHYALGYRFNGMTVWDVDDARVDAMGERIGALPFVTHCYRRPRHLPDWPYNLFAMVHCKSRADADRLVDEIAALLGPACRARDVLYSSRILKKTGLRIAG